jgi:hypothetical protein
MHLPRLVDVKADGLAEIVQPKQRCRGRIDSIYCLENAVAFKKAVSHTTCICIETDDLIQVVGRSCRGGTDAVRIVDVGGVSLRFDTVSIAVRRACGIDIKAYRDISIIYTK